jgi:hypothetical protein
MQQQDEPGPEAGRKFEIRMSPRPKHYWRNKSELPKYECSKQFIKSLAVQ